MNYGGAIHACLGLDLKLSLFRLWLLFLFLNILRFLIRLYWAVDGFRTRVRCLALLINWTAAKFLLSSLDRGGWTEHWQGNWNIAHLLDQRSLSSLRCSLDYDLVEFDFFFRLTWVFAITHITVDNVTIIQPLLLGDPPTSDLRNLRLSVWNFHLMLRLSKLVLNGHWLPH